MSNLPLKPAVNHNDDNDEQVKSTSGITTTKLPIINSRITSPSIIKLQQNTETQIANNRAYDEIHDLQPKHSLSKKFYQDTSNGRFSMRSYQSQQSSSHELMQGNYYDQTRYDADYTSSSNHPSESTSININVEDYKKTFTPSSINKNSNKNQTGQPPFGETCESIQKGVSKSVSELLECNKKQDNFQQYKTSIKTNNKSHEQATSNNFSHDDNVANNMKQRSSSSSSSSECSTSDSSTSNKYEDEHSETNIPYEKLLNDDDNDDQFVEQTKNPSTEPTTLLNRNQPQTYVTQSTTSTPYERSKYLPNNGYNSHGSSVTTKSSSDNSGSIRTNSGSENDEESDEEPYSNSTLSKNTPSVPTKDTSTKSLYKTTDIQYSSYINEQNNAYQLKRSNTTRMEQIQNTDELHLQVPRIKQSANDLNGNGTKLNSATDHNTIIFRTKPSTQEPSNSQTNISSSHENRSPVERNEHQQAHQSNNSRSGTTRPVTTGRKRKQSHQQDLIRAESIPGHRGDRDVDELVLFIDGGPSKQQQQTSAPLRSTDTNKPRLSSKLNALNDTNSNKTSTRKKSRKLSQPSTSSINNSENQTMEFVKPIEQDVQKISLVNESDQVKINSTNDTKDRSFINKEMPKENKDESHSIAVDSSSIKTTNDVAALSNAGEQKKLTSSLKMDDIDSYYLSSTITNINNLNSEFVSEPFVTVKNRRRVMKERRQDNTILPRSTQVPPPSTVAKPNDKRRVVATTKNNIPNPIVRNTIQHNKPNSSPLTRDEPNSQATPEPIHSSVNQPSPLPTVTTGNSNNEHTTEKLQQLSPRLSSHSSSSSSLSSSLLTKQQSKPPPVVFLNKSIDIELSDFSFGFEPDSIPTEKKPSDDDINNVATANDNNNNDVDQSLANEQDIHVTISTTATTAHPSTQSVESSDAMTHKVTKKYSQRSNRSPQFYSGSDIRPHQRVYPSQQAYVDPLLVLQYNQQRLANYSQSLAYMNYLRTPHYMSPQSQYMFLPTTPTAPAPAPAPVPVVPATLNEQDQDETTNQTSAEQTQEPLLVYSSPTGPLYYYPVTMKKTSIDSDPSAAPIPTVYTSAMYPPHYFYPSQTQQLVPSSATYFQPITSSAMSIDAKAEQNNINKDAEYKSPNTLYHQMHQPSSNIMSNALQLVYSQQRRNAQTDRFNLDDLTAYLAMKWTDTVDHYEQGDNQILLVSEQE